MVHSALTIVCLSVGIREHNGGMKATLKNLAVAILVLLVTGCSTVSKSDASLEYRVDEVRYGPSHMRDFEEHLNAIALEGWTLVGFNDMGSGLRVVASRPRRSP